jgi:acetyl esterase/lipase
VNDIIDAIGWLQTAGASAVTLVGDSSGGTIVAQTLLELARRKQLQVPSPRVESAVTLSGWLDLSDSSPSYHSHRWCRGECDGIGSQAFHMDPGVGQLKSMCDAMKYAGGNLSVSDPRLSPVQASPAILSLLPPMMLIIGGNEQLLGENLVRCAREKASQHSNATQNHVICGTRRRIACSTQGSLAVRFESASYLKHWFLTKATVCLLLDLYLWLLFSFTGVCSTCTSGRRARSGRSL